MPHNVRNKLTRFHSKCCRHPSIQSALCCNEGKHTFQKGFIWGRHFLYLFSSPWMSLKAVLLKALGAVVEMCLPLCLWCLSCRFATSRRAAWLFSICGPPLAVFLQTYSTHELLISCKFYFSALIVACSHENDLACLTCREFALCLFFLSFSLHVKWHAYLWNNWGHSVAQIMLFLLVTLCHLAAVCLEKLLFTCAPGRISIAILRSNHYMFTPVAVFCTCSLYSAVALHCVLLLFSGTRRPELTLRYNFHFVPFL